MRFALILASLPLVACGGVSHGSSGTVIPASGSGNTRSFQVGDFNRVDLRGADNVEVRLGSAFSVRAEGDSDVLDKLEIAKDGSTLKVGRKRSKWGWSDGDENVRVFVTLPRLTAASVAGSGNMDVDRAEGDFTGSIAGSGNLRVGALRGGKADLSVAGSGDMTIAGVATQLEVSIAGSGDINAAGLKATGADISIAGSGNLRAAVSGQADVSIVGSGDVQLSGGARCQVNSLGSGTARCV